MRHPSPRPPQTVLDCEGGVWISGYVKTEHAYVTASRWVRKVGWVCRAHGWRPLPNPMRGGFPEPSPAPAARLPHRPRPLSVPDPWLSQSSTHTLAGFGKDGPVNPRCRKQVVQVSR